RWLECYVTVFGHVRLYAGSLVRWRGTLVACARRLNYPQPAHQPTSAPPYPWITFRNTAPPTPDTPPARRPVGLPGAFAPSPPRRARGGWLLRVERAGRRLHR